VGWLHNRRKSAINEWDVFRRDGLPARDKCTGRLYQSNYYQAKENSNQVMNKAGSFVDPQGKSPADFEKTIFIWLDILGFAEALENEGAYERLAELLSKFKQKFNECHSYNSHIISDGIILWLKQPSANTLSEVLREIGKQQFIFTLETEEFIRGGISLGSKFEKRNPRESDDKENGSCESDFISSGLARAVKVETKEISWPIIGTTARELNRIRQNFPGIQESENFNLLRCFNGRGEDVYFIDFLEKSEKMLFQINSKIEKFKGDSHVRAKYIWLLKYYIDRFGTQKFCPSIEGAVL